MANVTGVLKVFSIAALIASWAGSSIASDQLLDPSFGVQGVATASLESVAFSGRKIVVQDDGKIVQVGDTRPGGFTAPRQGTLVRFNGDGSLDTSFGDQGLVRTSFSANSSDVGFAVGVQADGKIVAAGGAFIGSNFDLALIRFDATGQLDTSFGVDGKVIIDLGSFQTIYDIAFQSDGKIIAVGYTIVGGNKQFLIMRFTTQGELDTSFGTDGIVRETFPGNTEQEALSVAVLSDDSMIVAGGGIKPDGGTTTSLLKLSASGALDTSFNVTGKLATTIDGRSWARSVIVDSQGRYLVGGHSAPTAGGEIRFLVLRINANGSLDASFGDNGKVITEFPSPYTRGIAIWSLTLQNDGRIVAAGSGLNVPDNQNDLLMVRYQEDGSLDTSLDGGDGKVAITRDSNITVSTVTTQSTDGEERILVGGGLVGTDTSGFAVFRFRKPPIIFQDRFQGVGG